jgi:hypothetical protein
VLLGVKRTTRSRRPVRLAHTVTWVWAEGNDTEITLPAVLGDSGHRTVMIRSGLTEQRVLPVVCFLRLEPESGLESCRERYCSLPHGSTHRRAIDGARSSGRVGSGARRSAVALRPVRAVGWVSYSRERGGTGILSPSSPASRKQPPMTSEEVAGGRRILRGLRARRRGGYSARGPTNSQKCATSASST